MIRTQTSKGTPLRGRIARGATAATLALCALLAGGAPASADSGGHTAFEITPLGNNDYQVHIGIDVDMSRQDAEAILSGPGDEFSAKLYGDDEWYDNFLKYVPLTWATAWDGGLSAEFDGVVDGCVLNEDWGQDEVYGRVFLHDSRTNTTRRFDTRVISRSFNC